MITYDDLPRSKEEYERIIKTIQDGNVILIDENLAAENFTQKVKKIVEIITHLELNIKSKTLADDLLVELDETIKIDNFALYGFGKAIREIIESNEESISKSELQKMYANLKKMYAIQEEKTYYDDKTFLPNEKKLRKDIEKIEGPKIILVLKIVGFDEINNIYHYEGGNQILNEIIKKINTDFGEYNFRLYRIGGTTFSFLRYCYENGNKNREETLKFISDYVADFYINSTEFGKISIDLKVGAACQEKAQLENAKIALSQTKDSGEFIVYDQELEDKIHRESKEKMDCKNEIIKALNEGRIIPFFQGIRNNKTGEITKFESLVRLKKGNEIISPYNFLSKIEGTSIMKDVTKTMIKATIKAMKNNKFSFSINLTENDLNDTVIFELIKKELNRNRIKSSRLIIEILEENQGINKNFIEFIKKYKDLGTRIAIDDFGTGFSGFKRILKAEPDFLKIDGSLIEGITTDIKTWELVHGIVQFAHNMGAEAIAEYVENIEIQNELMKMGVNYSQGYLFSEPSEKIEI